MLLKCLEDQFVVVNNLQETLKLIKKALKEIGLTNLKILKQVPPRYLLVEYSQEYISKTVEVEFLFSDIGGGTRIDVKWPYTRELPLENETPLEFIKHQKEMKRKIDDLLNNFKLKIGAYDLPKNAN